MTKTVRLLYEIFVNGTLKYNRCRKAVNYFYSDSGNSIGYSSAIYRSVTNEVCSDGNGPEQLQMNISGKLLCPRINTAATKLKRNIMAWRSGGQTNTELVNNLKKNGIFSDERVRTAMIKVDRADFAPSSPYGDHPVSIGYGATISAPHMHASSLQLLKDHLKEGARVLDVGSGSGYLTVCMAEMIGETGKVIGIDHIEELVELSVNNTKKHHAHLIDTGKIKYVVGDGRAGYAPEAPYDAIHVGAAAPKLPEKLVEQLAKGGRMLIPVGVSQLNQRFLQVDKGSDGAVKTTDLMGVVYVPLTDKQNQV